ncbi:MAG: carbon-nitrogen family hydrolase [Vicinamibacteria bacterium]|jgi:predicted amidohydrolase|nr:carbon-nitrogen family hydrolase [Vicinamibacteria bacterium]
MILAGCQFDIAWEDKAANAVRVRDLLACSPLPRGSLLVLPEMYATGFSMNVACVAEGEARQGEQGLAEVARTHGLYVLGGVVTRAADGRGRNEAVLMGPDGDERCRYTKLHPFSFSGEDQHYQAGDEIVTFEWAGCTVAPFVCYDLRFPEIFRRAVRRGAEILAVIANWPEPRELHWTTLLRARAIENQAYVIGVNRHGRDPKTTYSGKSLIIDPRGQILAEAEARDAILQAAIDREALLAYRREFPALQDIRFV